MGIWTSEEKEIETADAPNSRSLEEIRLLLTQTICTCQ